MRRLLLLGLLLGLSRAALAQDQSRSPHGDLKVECAACHRPEGWTPVRISRKFDHGKLGFALAGAHATANCRACHESLDFKGTSTSCTACHQDPHRGELGVECGKCHTPRSFLDRSAMARAHQLTRFPLEGSHLAADCAGCHTPTAQGGLQFVSRATECVSCHWPDYQAAKNPDHLAGGFPQDCDECHAPTLWQRARFNHAASRFPLTGAHRAVPCNQCHVNNRFTGTATDCVSCHQQDYNGAANPSHTQSQFPTTCTDCHTTTAWVPGSFDHSGTAFPLTGQHKNTPCLDCHGDGVYQGKPTQCASCHQTDYTQTTNPDHQTAGFPTDCASCHNTSGWDGATFDHDQFFRIYSGHHKGRWDSCNDCHQVAADFAQFTCLTCHEHNQTETDGHHRGVSGYQYISTECLRCHPRA
jgi:hypothetical protein